MSYITIDLSKTNQEFTETDLRSYNDIMDWPKIFPEVFGKDLPPEIVFDDFYLGDNSTVDFTVQRFRDGRGVGSSSKLNKLSDNMDRNGYKLKYPAPCWFDWGRLNSPNGHQREVITGNGRGFTLQNTFQMKNSIVGLFGPAKGYSVQQVEDALEECGGVFNTIHDPAEPISMSEVKKLTSNSIARFQKTDGEAGTPNTIGAILQKVTKLCGSGLFTENKRHTMAQEVFNNYNPHSVVVPWTNVKTGEFNIAIYMKKFKFMNTATVKFLPVSFATISQAWHKAYALSVTHPSAEIRVVPHTGTLEGDDYHNTYKSRIAKFVDVFTTLTENALEAFNTSVPDEKGNIKKQKPLKNKVSVYAAFPALGEFHNIDKPVYITGDNLYQKDVDNSDNYSVSLSNVVLNFTEEDDE